MLSSRLLLSLLLKPSVPRTKPEFWCWRRTADSWVTTSSPLLHILLVSNAFTLKQLLGWKFMMPKILLAGKRVQQEAAEHFVKARGLGRISKCPLSGQWQDNLGPPFHPRGTISRFLTICSPQAVRGRRCCSFTCFCSEWPTRATGPGPCHPVWPHLWLVPA